MGSGTDAADATGRTVIDVLRRISRSSIVATPRMRVALVVGVLAGLLSTTAVGGVASAAQGPRFKLRAGLTQAQAIRKTEQKFNRTPGFSNADCWLWDGNARIGWRHGSCVGSFNYQGTTFKLKATYTPISCSRQRAVIVISGLKTQRTTVPWKHDTFVCSR